MSRREIKNMAASARRRLLEKSRTEGLAFNQMIQRYAMERFLYRLSVSEFSDSFYLKGALLFWVWGLPERRTTMDIDLLGFMDNSLEGIEEAIRKICALDVPDDGLLFDVDNLRVQRIKEDADYEGARVVFRAELDTAVIAMQVDIGFGDRVGQGVDTYDFPVLLDMPVPRLKCYPVETVVAEKFEAMVKLELLNSRMKDFYDIWLLSRQQTFEMPSLLEACRATFRQRGTPCSLDNPLFGLEMKESKTKQTQWSAFCRKSKFTSCPDSFAEMLEELFVFLLPLASELTTDKSLAGFPPSSLMRFMHDMSVKFWLKCSRIDLAFDDFEKIIRPAEVAKYANQGSYKGFRKHRPVIEQRRDGELLGEGIYFGTRGKSGGGKYLRCYGKDIESNGETDSIRWEVEFSKEKANRVFFDLAMAQSLMGFATMISLFIGGAIDFIERGSSGKYSKIDRLAFWEQILHHLGAATIRCPEPDGSIEKTIGWFERSVYPSIEKVRRAIGDDQLYQRLLDGMEGAKLSELQVNQIRVHWNVHSHPPEPCFP